MQGGPRRATTPLTWRPERLRLHAALFGARGDAGLDLIDPRAPETPIPTPKKVSPSKVAVSQVPVDALDVPALLDRVGSYIRENRQATIGYVNVHVFNEAARHPDLRAFLQRVDLCYADGQGVVLAAKILGGELPGRMTGADWIYDLSARATKEGWTIGWIGGEPGVTGKAAEVLCQRNPGLRVVVTEHGFDADNPEVLGRLVAARPDILLVGMGTPIQERWVAAHRASLPSPVVWCVGATADFVSGKVPRGPAFLHQNQEWLARLLVDPRRLWRRFLLGNPLFFSRVLWERLRR